MKQETITFKADAALAEALRRMPNRSEFLRAAVLSALDNACPLCGGSGALSMAQREHWTAFAKKHRFVKCGDCGEYQLACADAAAPSPCGHREALAR